MDSKIEHSIELAFNNGWQIQVLKTIVENFEEEISKLKKEISELKATMETVTTDDKFVIDRGTVFTIHEEDLKGVVKKGEQININGQEYTIKDIELVRGWPGTPQRYAFLV